MSLRNRDIDATQYRLVQLPGRPAYYLPRDREVLRATLRNFYRDGQRLYRRSYASRTTQASIE